MSLFVASCFGEDNRERILGAWTLESIVVDSTQLDVEGISTRTFADVPAWVEFDGSGRLHGEAACNDFNGDHSFAGETLTPSDVVSSAAACESGQEAARALLSQLWGESIQVTFDGDNSMVWATKDTTTVFIRRS